MLKSLAKPALHKVGGSCYCCCYREPYVEGYEGVRAGRADNVKSCARKCTGDPSIYAGFMSCYETFDLVTCSSLDNQALARDIEYSRRTFKESLWADVDLDQLRGGNSNAY